MGYESRLSGEFIIDPPLGTNDLARDPLERTELFSDPALQIKTESKSRTDDDGTAWYTQFGIKVVPRDSGSVRAYTIEREISALAEVYPDRTFVGWIVREGSEQGDVERYAIRGGKRVTQRAQLTWPDGSPVEELR